ncbi:MAG TPA: filamentous hemagglutinin N-terminal domain-containing protein, partial [Rhodocyclaceae bacterium]|nr:filamentous hemagglutinin N-terminal domain-containing protein [Rhodocyclaceae bacterium]
MHTAAAMKDVYKSAVFKLRLSGGKTLTYDVRPKQTISTLLGMLLASFSGYSFAVDVNALPTGGVVGAGTAGISQNGSAMQITQASQNVVVNWNSFDIGANASVNFVQPDASSVALNRVVSQDPSHIFGSLTANGKVFLTNPSGVIFGSAAKVDVGGLVATTLSISDADFLAGKYSFAKNGTAGSVVNLGSIVAADSGYVALLAPEVRNEGVIAARLGTVALASGNKITLDTFGDGLIKVAVTEGAVGAMASNKGLIKADGGLVYIGARNAGDLAATVINNEGVVEAKGLVEREGKILLLADSGVAINSGSLDASAGATNVNGGDVRVLSSVKSTQTSTGSISVRGGSAGGDAGFVEISAPMVTIGGQVDLAASHGTAGTFLIDPDDVEISDVGARQQASWSFVDAATVRTTLSGGGTVSVTTTGFTGTASAGQDIEVNSDIVPASGVLNLTAGEDIRIQANVNVGTLNMQAGQRTDLNSGGVSQNSGAITATTLIARADSTISLNSLTVPSLDLGINSALAPAPGTGTVNVTGWGGGSVTAATNNKAIAITATGAISSANLNSGTANSNITASSTLAIGPITAGNLTATANGAITSGGAIAVTGTSSLTAGSGNNITLDNASNNFGIVTVVSGNNVTIVDSNAIDLGNMAVSGTLAVTAGGAITDSGVLTVTGASTFAAGANAIALDTSTNNFVGAVSATGSNVTLVDTNAIDLGASTVTGNLVVTAAGAVTDSGVLSVSGTTSLTAGTANNITLDSANNFIGAVGVVSANNVVLNDSNDIVLGASTVSGAYGVTAAGDITETGVLAVTGASTFTTTAATKDVLLHTQANDFTGAVTITTAGAGSHQDIGLRNVNVGASLAGVPATGIRNLTITFNNAAVALPVTTLTGNLAVTAGGTITDNAAIAVTGTTSLTAGAANNITLDNANNFVGAVGIVSGNNVTLNDTNALDLGAATVSGNLVVTTAGAITDSGALAVTGTTSLTAGAANNITLDNANNFVGAVGVVSGNTVTL